MAAGTPETTVPPAGHVVCLYQRDSELAATVVPYLRAGLVEGGIVIVASTAGHERAFVAGLAAQGVDVAAERAAGGLIFIDAEAAAVRLAADGTVDVRTFEHEIGSVVRAAVATGRPVRVMGEIVAVLWARGQVNLAMELEQRWNGLASEVSFPLLCAYPDGPDERLAEVCRLHREIIEVVTVDPAFAIADSRWLPPAIDTPTRARRWLVGLLRGAISRRALDDAALIATELVTNAVRHVGSPVAVSVTASVRRLRLSVGDASHDAPVVRPLSPSATSGRGLVLVASIASRWGVEVSPQGKVVWAEIDLDR